MVIRWVICPVVRHDKGWLAPKVGTLVDVGVDEVPDIDNPPATLPVSFGYSAVYIEEPITVGSKCLIFTRGEDFTEIDKDEDCISILEKDLTDGDDYLAKTPREDSWSVEKIARIEQAVSDQTSVVALNVDRPLWEFVRDVGRTIHPKFQGPQGVYVGLPRKT